jgi:uncharacterized protein (DUF2062 family)
MNLKRWLHQHSLKLLAIRDTPEAIAGGVAIGIFFGFIPLFGLKTLSAIFFAWLTRSNIIAAVLAGTLHDVLLPFMPMIYRWEYDIGYWLLSTPHEWPQPLRRMKWSGHDWRNWTTFLTVGRPWLVGSAVCSAPFALLSFALTKIIVARHHRKKRAELAALKTQPEKKEESPKPHK